MPADVISRLVASGAHVIDLQLDNTVTKALIREAQWDVFMRKLLHVDFQRVDPEARVDVEVDVVTRGTLATGVLDHLVHKVTLSCLAYLIPERLEVKIGHLKIGDSLTVANLELPTGATCKLAADSVVVRVHEAKNVEIVQASASGAQPEVIGRKKADEGEDA